MKTLDDFYRTKKRYTKHETLLWAATGVLRGGLTLSDKMTSLVAGVLAAWCMGLVLPTKKSKQRHTVTALSTLAEGQFKKVVQGRGLSYYITQSDATAARREHTDYCVQLQRDKVKKIKDTSTRHHLDGRVEFRYIAWAAPGADHTCAYPVPPSDKRYLSEAEVQKAYCSHIDAVTGSLPDSEITACYTAWRDALYMWVDIVNPSTGKVDATLCERR